MVVYLVQLSAAGTTAQLCPRCGRTYYQPEGSNSTEIAYLRTISFRVGFIALITLLFVIGSVISFLVLAAL
jgi:hypothetical protein